ncbi:MAG TPA: Holliday junction resolvase RuvX [bacterium]|nr:Holliday junction resolvase RuvX [bacterium]
MPADSIVHSKRACPIVPSSEDIGVLGIDYGSSKIGLAFGRAGVVSPIRVISARNFGTAISEIARVIKEYAVSKIVVGLPLTVDNKETPKSIEVRKFVKLLKSRVKIPVEFINEFYTTKEASVVMLNVGVSQEGRRVDDHYSASLILKRYFAESETAQG